MRAMSKERIHSDAAPKAVGAYSQAIKTGDTVYLSGQIPLDPATSKLVEGSFDVQLTRIFDNLQAVAEAAGGSLAEIAKLTVYLTDMKNYPALNEVMARYFKQPYPARAVVQVAGLPLGVSVEIDAILVREEDYSY
jgi:reactive intermediate/imine deaminase